MRPYNIFFKLEDDNMLFTDKKFDDTWIMHASGKGENVEILIRIICLYENNFYKSFDLKAAKELLELMKRVVANAEERSKMIDDD